MNITILTKSLAFLVIWVVLPYISLTIFGNVAWHYTIHPKCWKRFKHLNEIWENFPQKRCLGIKTSTIVKYKPSIFGYQSSLNQLKSTDFVYGQLLRSIPDFSPKGHGFSEWKRKNHHWGINPGFKLRENFQWNGSLHVVLLNQLQPTSINCSRSLFDQPMGPRGLSIWGRLPLGWRPHQTPPAT